MTLTKGVSVDSGENELLRNQHEMELEMQKQPTQVYFETETNYMVHTFC